MTAVLSRVGARVLQALDEGVQVAIVTTKAERFARALLRSQHPRLAAVPIIGREPDRTVPKPESLLRLGREHGLPPTGAGLWFVEDMLETLELVRATSGLSEARLFLAGWGYNTLEHRASAGGSSHVGLLSLHDFAAPFGVAGCADARRHPPCFSQCGQTLYPRRAR